MPRVISLNKVQKSIRNKRRSNPTALHEGSRDARRLKRASDRDEKLSTLKSKNDQSKQSHLQRIAYFQQLIKSSDLTTYDAEDILTLTREFIRRNDDTIAEAKAMRRAGRPPSKHETNLTQLKDAEERELKAGFWVPDLRDAEVVKKLREWEGEWVALGQMVFVRVDGDGVVKQAQWPPNR